MGLKVTPAGEADIARCVAIEQLAYADNPYSPYLFPGPFEGGSDSSREEAMIANRRADPEACLWIQAVDEDRVAQGLPGMVSFSQGYMWESTPKPQPARVWGHGSNLEACDLFFGGMTRKWEERMSKKSHFYLKLLHTDPAHQRRGAGSMLLQHFADEADKRGLESYLEATDEGRPLYEKFGYETVDKLVTDFGKWGGPDNVETCLMLRKPKTGGK